MSRFAATNDSSASEDEQLARSAINQAWGGVPNLGAVLALSLPLTRAVLAFDAALEGGSLSARVVEQLAIAVSEKNRCAYCLAAHTAAARSVGVSAADIASARIGQATDAKTAAALRFAQQVVGSRGVVSDSELAAVRADGWRDAEILEIVGHALATTLSNYVHHISEVEIDYPAVPFAAAESAVTQLEHRP
jgi:AhpD family alkylhydroperoxidase